MNIVAPEGVRDVSPLRKHICALFSSSDEAICILKLASDFLKIDFRIDRCLSRHSEFRGYLFKTFRALVSTQPVCHSMYSLHQFSARDPMLYLRITLILATLCSIPSAQAQDAPLANATVLVVRHAEKPASGTGLTAEGSARANKYAQYFHPFHADGTTVAINALYAGADSADSVRPRLTLEPLSHATGIPLKLQFSTNEPEALAHALFTEPHGDHVLIAWRHKKIPALLKSLGADPAQLLPDGVWPDAVYDWVILLHYDAAGHLETQKLIHEPDPLP